MRCGFLNRVQIVCVWLFFIFFWVFSVARLVASTSTIDCLESIVSEMTWLCQVKFCSLTQFVRGSITWFWSVWTTASDVFIYVQGCLSVLTQYPSCQSKIYRCYWCDTIHCRRSHNWSTSCCTMLVHLDQFVAANVVLQIQKIAIYQNLQVRSWEGT